MHERRLPQSVLAKGSLEGNEYAWPFSAVEEVLAAAEEAGLATLGGQVQVRFPDGTAELYWLDADSTARQADEPWAPYVRRSAAEVKSGFRRIVAETNFRKEIREWPFLCEKEAAGVNVLDHLCFVLYFEAEPSE